MYHECVEMFNFKEGYIPRGPCSCVECTVYMKIILFLLELCPRVDCPISFHTWSLCLSHSNRKHSPIVFFKGGMMVALPFVVIKNNLYPSCFSVNYYCSSACVELTHSWLLSCIHCPDFKHVTNSNQTKALPRAETRLKHQNPVCPHQP